MLSGVAEWVKSRVTKRRGKYEIRASMGIAERKSPSETPFSQTYRHELFCLMPSPLLSD